MTGRVTIKQAAMIMNVSPRMISMARTISRKRPELEAPIMAGTMTVAEAYRIVTGKPKPTSWDRLVKAWNNATDDDRERFLFAMRAAI